jgi:hypothetical protein
MQASKRVAKLADAFAYRAYPMSADAVKAAARSSHRGSRGVGEGLAYLTESYNRIAHNVSPISC